MEPISPHTGIVTVRVENCPKVGKTFGGLRQYSKGYVERQAHFEKLCAGKKRSRGRVPKPTVDATPSPPSLSSWRAGVATRKR